MIKLILGLLLFTHTAFADEVNLLKNPGFESKLSSWSKTGSSTFTIESSSPLEGTYSAKWDPSATGEFFRSSSYTVPAGLLGVRCVLEVKYVWNSGTSGHIYMNVDDGTNNLATLSLTPTTSSVPTRAFVPFSCPTSGTVRAEFESTANAAEITLDAVFLGSGRNIINSTPQDIFSAAVSSIDTVSNENIDWINGNCTNATTGKATCTFTSGLFTNSPNCSVAGNSATDGRIVTIETISSSAITVTTTDDAGTLADIGFSIVCQKNDSAANKEALTLDTIGASWTGYHDNTCAWTTTSSSFADFSDDASCALVEKTNKGMGTVTTYGASGPGVIWTPKVIATYQVCAFVAWNVSASGVDAGLQLIDSNGVSITERVAYQASGGLVTSSLCGLATPSSAGSTYSVRLKGKTASNTLNVPSSIATDTEIVSWSIVQITQQFPAPVFTEVQNKLDAGESSVKTCAAYVDESGGVMTLTKTIPSGCVASLTENGTGDTTNTFAASFFSSTPICVAIGQSGRYPSYTTLSSSVFRVTTWTDTGVASDQDYNIICIGK